MIALDLEKKIWSLVQKIFSFKTVRPQTREAKGEQSSSVQTNQRVGAFFFDQKGALKTLNKTSQLVIRY